MLLFPVEPNRICPRIGTSTVHISTNTSYLKPPPRTIQNYPGSRTCPWVINTEKGRKINVSIVSFSTVMQSYNPGALPMQCDDFIVIVDNDMTIERAICSDQRREKFVYSSTSNELTISIKYSRSVEPSGRYLIQLASECMHSAHVTIASYLAKDSTQNSIGVTLYGTHRDRYN